MKSIIREMKVDMIDEIRIEMKEEIMKETKEINGMTEMTEMKGMKEMKEMRGRIMKEMKGRIMKEIMKIKVCLNKIVREEHSLKNLNNIQKMIQKELK